MTAPLRFLLECSPTGEETLSGALNGSPAGARTRLEGWTGWLQEKVPMCCDVGEEERACAPAGKAKRVPGAGEEVGAGRLKGERTVRGVGGGGSKLIWMWRGISIGSHGLRERVRAERGRTWLGAVAGGELDEAASLEAVAASGCWSMPVSAMHRGYGTGG